MVRAIYDPKATQSKRKAATKVKTVNTIKIPRQSTSSSRRGKPPRSIQRTRKIISSRKGGDEIYPSSPQQEDIVDLVDRVKLVRRRRNSNASRAPLLNDFQQDQNSTLLQAPLQPTSLLTFKVGDNIEARYLNGLIWFPGVIIRAHRDGSYSIQYNDGDKEEFVPGHLIRRKLELSRRMKSTRYEDDFLARPKTLFSGRRSRQAKSDPKIAASVESAIVARRGSVGSRVRHILPVEPISHRSKLGRKTSTQRPSLWSSVSASPSSNPRAGPDHVLLRNSFTSSTSSSRSSGVSFLGDMGYGPGVYAGPQSLIPATRMLGDSLEETDREVEQSQLPSRARGRPTKKSATKKLGRPSKQNTTKNRPVFTQPIGMPMHVTATNYSIPATTSSSLFPSTTQPTSLHLLTDKSAMRLKIENLKAARRHIDDTLILLESLYEHM